MTNQPKQKTAMRQLIVKLDEAIEIYSKENNPEFDSKIALLKATKVTALSLEPVNEQQIIDARKDGIIDEHRLPEHQRTSEQYFKDTFEKP